MGDLSLGDYLDIVRRRKWWIVLTMLATFIVSVIVARSMKDIFRAETVILVDSSQVPYNYVAPVVTTDIASRLTTLQQQVLSPTRLKKLVEAEGLYPDPTGKAKSEDDVIRAMQKSITVEVVNPGGGKMGAFRIAYSSKNRAEVARIANEIAHMFIEENLKAREDITSGTAQFLDDQMTQTRRKLDETDAELRSIKSKNPFDLPESKSYHMEALATLRGQVQAIEDKVNQDRRDKTMLQSLMYTGGGMAPTMDVDSAGGQLSPDEVRAQKLEARLSELRVRYGPEHPEVRRTEMELDSLRKRIAAAAANPKAVVNQKPAIQIDKTNPRNPVLQAQIEKLDEDINEQNRQLPALQQQMEFHTTKLAEIPAFEQRISRIEQDNDALRKEYADLVAKKQSAEMSYALEIRQKAERFVVLDAAQTPTKPAAPNRPLITFGGLMAGAFLGIALAVAVEMNDESVRSENEAARLLGKPVLAAVPKLISAEERKSMRMRAAALVACTVVGSAGVGLLLSLFSGRFF